MDIEGTILTFAKDDSRQNTAPNSMNIDNKDVNETDKTNTDTKKEKKEEKEEKGYMLPEHIDEVRVEIERRQSSNVEEVSFSSREIQAEVRSRSSETFTFTDLPGIFLMSEQKIGHDYARSRLENEKLKQTTMEITKKYLSVPNTIVLVVISSTDWIHGMNNDSLIANLAEWLEQVRKERDVPVYGVITKLDTQETLSANSPIKKILCGGLDKSHILNGLSVRKWIPVISSSQILNETDKVRAHNMELEAIHRCLRNVLTPAALNKLSIGRTALLKQLKYALLESIADTHGKMHQQLERLSQELDHKVERLPQILTVPEKRRVFDHRLKIMENVLADIVGTRSSTPGGSYSSLSSSQLSSISTISSSISARSLKDGNINADLSISNTINDISIPILSSSITSTTTTIPTKVTMTKAENDKYTARLKLLVEAPAKFEQELGHVTLRGQLSNEVKYILDQASLEQGGGFDSDTSFNLLSAKIVERYTGPCLNLIERCAKIILSALIESIHTAFGDYPQLERLVLLQLVHLNSSFISQKTSTSSTTTTKTSILPTYKKLQQQQQQPMFEYLRAAALCKVENLLDAFKSMTCFHPMWRNFEVLYAKILPIEEELRKNKERKDRIICKEECTLPEIMELPALAKRAYEEGDLAIEQFERESKIKTDIYLKNKTINTKEHGQEQGQEKENIAIKLTHQHRIRISKHFARVEVMGYIIRLTLISSVYPLVIRDLRDGLFRGVRHGNEKFDHSATTLLRAKLLFDPTIEKCFLESMDPSIEDTTTRLRLLKRQEIVNSLRADFISCQSRLERLSELMHV